MTHTQEIALIVDIDKKIIITAPPVVLVVEHKEKNHTVVSISEKMIRLEDEVTRLTSEKINVILQVEELYKSSLHKIIRKRMKIMNMQEFILQQICNIFNKKEDK